jgi:hypothetical protein
MFAHCLCDTLESLLEAEYFDTTIRDTWFRVIMNLAAIFLDAGSEIEKEGYHGIVYRKSKGSVFQVFQINLSLLGQWKKSAMSLTLESLLIWNSETKDKLRYSYPFISKGLCVLFPNASAIQDLEMLSLEAADAMSPPEPNVFVVTIILQGNNTKTQLFISVFDDMVDEWISQLHWRILATHRFVAHVFLHTDPLRAYKSSDSTSEEDVMFFSPSASTRAKKQVKKIQYRLKKPKNQVKTSNSRNATDTPPQKKKAGVSSGEGDK